MANLFSKSAIKQAISMYQGLDISREIAIVQELYDDFRKGNMKDETRYEQNFNELFFHQLLGYDPKVNFHPKASTPVGSKIADVGLGFFADGLYSYEGVKVVVELKGCETMLDKKQASYGGQSPVDQGFGYKTSFTHCPWLIVSNFASVRLYRDNKQDFEVRTIEELANPENDYYHLKTLLGLLKRNHLISQTGASFSETLLSEVRIKQEQITKDFYKQYKTLRLELINDIRQHNTDVSVEVAVEKAQKIIDRIIFIHFCEDRGLLPEGKLKTNLLKGHEVDLTPWEVLKLYFRGVDKGSEKLGIPNGYNGGLFQEDVVLNNLEIGKSICHKFIDLGHYNFDDELSVNILGHIFEQSISDIEQLKGELLGQEIVMDTLVDPSITPNPSLLKRGEKKESKRKKDGIFYTPEYIVDYIVQNSLMTYLEEKENECLAQIGKKGGYKTEIEAYQAYQHILQQVKVLDPACGSGAFLVRVFDYLYTENKRVGQIIGSLFSTDEIYKSILRDNIYGVDLNPESVEITKLSLWLKSAQQGKKLNNLDANIKCGNSLIDDPAIAGERAFDWQKEFADIMGAGGFDVVVGNPPYVQLQKMKEESDKISKLGYEVFEKTGDLYCLFYELGVKLLKQNGYLGYITSNKRLRANYGSSLRKYLADNTDPKVLIDLGSGIFESATVDSNILIAIKKQVDHYNLLALDISKEKSLISFELLNNKAVILSTLGSASWTISQAGDNEIFEKIAKQGVKLKDRNIEINYGIKTGYNDAFVIDQKTYERFIQEDPRNKEILKPLLRGRDINRYYIEFDNLYLIATFPSMNIDINLYPIINNHLLSFGKERLEQNGKKGARKKTGNQWFETQDQISYRKAFGKEKIIYPEIVSEHGFTIDNNGYYANNKCFILYGEDIKYLSSVLNSKVGKYLCHKYCVSLGKQGYEYRKVFIEQMPIKSIPLQEQKPFIEKADFMLSLNKELHDKVDFVLRFLQQKYNIEKVSTKLGKFRELNFAQFLKELKVKKLSMSDEADLMRYFDEQKTDIVALKSRIDATDREIDNMVYTLYGLTDEERAIVEGR